MYYDNREQNLGIGIRDSALILLGIALIPKAKIYLLGHIYIYILIIKGYSPNNFIR